MLFASQTTFAEISGGWHELGGQGVKSLEKEAGKRATDAKGRTLTNGRHADKESLTHGSSTGLVARLALLPKWYRIVELAL